jgi:hypothetical protein
MPEAKKEGFSI